MIWNDIPKLSTNVISPIRKFRYDLYIDKNRVIADNGAVHRFDLQQFHGFSPNP